MIHFLQTLWWEWKWRRLKSARSLLAGTIPLVESNEDRFALIAKACELEREMGRLEAKMKVRPT